MSTRSRIAIRNTDGTITSVYCHSDGYPDHNGAILLRSYNTEDKARALVNLGGLSFLDDEIGHATPEHTFNKPKKGWTVAYHRDRGEKFAQETHRDARQLLASAANSWGAYVYLWDTTEPGKGCWFVSDHGGPFYALNKVIEARSTPEFGEPKPDEPHTVIITVKGGVAEVTQCPEGIDVIIDDQDDH